MKPLLTAIRFLTIIPIPGGEDVSEGDIARSSQAFPLVGLLIGMLLASLAWGLGYIFPPMLRAGFLVIAMIAISGGFHLDGLADTADGFFSSRPKEKILEIMKDSRVGVMGVIAILSVMLLKFCSLSWLGGDAVCASVFLSVMAGRCMMLAGMNFLRPAVPAGGLGATFMRDRSIALGVCGLIFAGAFGWLACGWAGVISIGVAIVVLVIFSLSCYRKIGGATGDTLGAICELAELSVLLTLASQPVQSLFRIEFYELWTRWTY